MILKMSTVLMKALYIKHTVQLPSKSRRRDPGDGYSSDENPKQKTQKLNRHSKSRHHDSEEYSSEEGNRQNQKAKQQAKSRRQYKVLMKGDDFLESRSARALKHANVEGSKSYEKKSSGHEDDLGARGGQGGNRIDDRYYESHGSSRREKMDEDGYRSKKHKRYEEEESHRKREKDQVLQRGAGRGREQEEERGNRRDEKDRVYTSNRARYDDERSSGREKKI
ncbi:Hypothetical predicted protein [Olea europaea subsp. europaea]|uniref:Uncharacterized protein n=1 Tax=Olea europaea subsp. europaea TaxID=158383 RepID=A0A8S0SN88_OLEEU|nr:Hypothetical predicted protein [Olea europaea subsp. europaea]